MAKRTPMLTIIFPRSADLKLPASEVKTTPLGILYPVYGPVRDSLDDAPTGKHRFTPWAQVAAIEWEPAAGGSFKPPA